MTVNAYFARVRGAVAAILDVDKAYRPCFIASDELDVLDLCTGPSRSHVRVLLCIRNLMARLCGVTDCTIPA
ncbi:hypothetical protein FQU76_29485 [Streptomyces qinzhouensis]|uniref:Uncharacterized protein n=1 Tax=Streptomyces qinzhouensis TaxID=2599401 RepID=A0A5B8JTF6_9ACTN|nr:hypothetical protein FQU76_29485 [Streptomyces qinzhouensis]